MHTLGSAKRDREPSTALFLLDHDRMMPGDVLLERGSRWTSNVITAVDGGSYSHVLMWVGSSNLVEAVHNGVRLTSSQRIVISDPARWKLLRLVADPIRAEYAARYARTLLDTKYSVAGALTSVVPRRRDRKDRRLFCSQLIAEAYGAVGVKIVPRVRIGNVTPARIESDSVLTPVELPLIPIPPEQAEHWLEVTDRDETYASSLTKEQSDAAAEIMALVSPKLAALSLGKRPPFKPRNLTEVLNYLQYDTSKGAQEVSTLLLQEFKRRDFFAKYWVGAVLQAKALLREDLKHWPGLDQDLRKALVRTLDIKGNDYARKRYGRNLQFVIDAYLRTGHELWRVQMQAYRTCVLEIEEMGKLIAQFTETPN